MKRLRVGIITLFLKVGPTLLAVLAKAVKAVKIGKVGLAAASMASYAYLFTWEFAAMIMLLLFVHESGHIWAMKSCGMKTKGIYFLPFVGGAAVTEDAFSSRAAEAYVAIMGPIWGLALSLVAWLAYMATLNPEFAAASSWMALINLFNLLPICPLDGGRILKSIAFSLHSAIGLIALSLGILASLFISLQMGFSLIYLLLAIGTIELMYEYNGRRTLKKLIAKQSKEQISAEEDVKLIMLIQMYEKSLGLRGMNKKGIALYSLGYLSLSVVLLLLMLHMKHVTGADIAFEIMKG